MKYKEHIVSFMFLLFFIFMLYSPASTIDAALNGMTLFADIIFPSLFPFFVLTAMLPAISWVNMLAGLFGYIMKPLFNVSGQGALVFIAGSLSGFPIGAKMTADLLKNNKISIPDAQRLICYTNGASPMFLIGAVAGGLMNRPSLGITLFLCHLSGNILIGIAAGRLIKGSSLERNPPVNQQADYLALFRDSVTVSVKQLMIIGGLITFFSVCIQLIEQLLSSFSGGWHAEKLQVLISGILELSNGVDAAVRYLEPATASLIVLAMVSFSGLCIHMQVMTFIDQIPISYKPYLVSRLFHMVLSPIIFLIYQFFFPLQDQKVPAEDVMAPLNHGINITQSVTVIVLFICIFILLQFQYKQKPRC
ncbi:hypothetical protein [Jeotgalibacillus haloalkalitolerans]|uniref:Sporulation integral membrane protein YlbJ n=1 Tax=Jeotgalibacillus haloalkalitolerans TaxID=3104292 RepID=A0ABU5KJX1_9BACL|nr:hypothetical protein [Jeotgalibacillus sp. HH7-29]MDZ5711546.1 hypothetical protein [Jeotgalibacillus sp. HH7-29]